MAVQGAAPSKIAPARYSLAKAGAIQGSNTTIRKNQAMANIVKGLISQFTMVVMASPFGSFLTPTIAPKSICAIIGKIIAQIRIAIGMDTWAYSKRDRVSGIPGANWPKATPAIIARATQTDR